MPTLEDRVQLHRDTADAIESLCLGDGREIQVLCGNEEWRKHDGGISVGFFYRIKPKAKYRPYTIAEIAKFIGQPFLLDPQNPESTLYIQGVRNDDVTDLPSPLSSVRVLAGGDWIFVNALCAGCIWCNGSKMGVRVNDDGGDYLSETE